MPRPRPSPTEHLRVNHDLRVGGLGGLEELGNSTSDKGRRLLEGPGARGGGECKARVRRPIRSAGK